jgi:hypothetical protein
LDIIFVGALAVGEHVHCCNACGVQSLQCSAVACAARHAACQLPMHTMHVTVPARIPGFLLLLLLHTYADMLPSLCRREYK